MRDAYDFSGAERGRFHRPGAGFADLRAKRDEPFRESGKMSATIRERPGRVIS